MVSKEKKAEYARNWRAKNKEKVAFYNRRYSDQKIPLSPEQKEKKSLKEKRYRLRNKEKVSFRNHEYYLNNREKILNEQKIDL